MTPHRPLQRFAAKLTSLVAVIEAAPPLKSGPLPEGLILFSRADVGSVSMVPPASIAYSEFLDGVATEFTKKRPISRRAVESAVQLAVLRALGARNSDAAPLPERITTALVGLDTDLHAPLLAWTIHTPIIGAAIPRSGLRLGGVHFHGVFPHVARRWHSVVRSIIQESPTPPASKTRLIRNSAEVINEFFAGQIVGTVTVDAVDFEAARTVAATRVRQVLDVINFYADLLYPKSFRCAVTQPGDAQPTDTAHVAFQGDQQASVRPFQSGPRQAVILSALLTRKAVAGRTLFRWIASDHPTPLQTRILSAARWAGRATVEERRDQAFLNYYIALETLLKGSESRELSYRLGIRCAHLLGRARGGREWINRTMRDLTGRRNAVVHSGNADVTDQELQFVRMLAKRAVVVAASGRFKSMSVEDFDHWLEARAIR